MATGKQRLIEEAQAEVARLLEERIDEERMTLDEIEAVVEETMREMARWVEERLIQEQQPPPSQRAACPQCAASCAYKRDLDTTVLTIHGPRRIRRSSGVKRPLRPSPRCSANSAGSRLAPPRLSARRSRSGKPCGRQRRPGSPRLKTRKRGKRRRPPTACISRWMGPWARCGIRGSGMGRPGSYSAATARPSWAWSFTLGKRTVWIRKSCAEVAWGPWPSWTGSARACSRWPSNGGWARRGSSLRSGTAPSRVPSGRWKLMSTHFPQAVQILDFWHMTEHLWKVARTMHGAGTAACQAWVQQAQWDLKHDLTHSFLRGLEEWNPATETAQEVRRVELGYFRENATRMQYGTYLAHGYMIGSGVMESACRQLATQRLDREETADAVLAIRTHRLSTGAPPLSQYA